MCRKVSQFYKLVQVVREKFFTDFRAFQQAGLSQELQVIQEHHLSNPSRGGSRGYPKYEHEEALQLAEQVGVTAEE